MTVPTTSIFSGRTLSREEQAGLAIIVGLACAIGVWLVIQRMPVTAFKDFTYPWRAARALLAGQDPYVVIQPTGHYPFEARFPYPLTAALVATPVAWLAGPIAAALFFGLSSGALAWGLLRDGGVWRLWTLASVPFAMAMSVVQWSPLLVAGALLPAFGWAFACKPTVGLALFAARPSWQAVVGGVALTVASLVILPAWPREWLAVTATVRGHGALVMHPFGWLPLLALVRWRDGDARLVAALACVPQNPFFYDQLPLLLVARSGRSAATLAALSWIAYVATKATCADPNYCGDESAPWVLWLLYVPATALVLARGDWSGTRARIATWRRASGTAG